MKDKILDWIFNGEVGVSSKCIAAVIATGKPPKRFSDRFTPSDPSDLLRCLKLLKWIPEIRERLDEMISVSCKWSKLIAHWNQLEKLFLSEAPEEKWDKYWEAPKTYQMMKELGL